MKITKRKPRRTDPSWRRLASRALWLAFAAWLIMFAARCCEQYVGLVLLDHYMQQQRYWPGQ